MLNAELVAPAISIGNDLITSVISERHATPRRLK